MMKVTSLTYTRSAKIADPINRYENHDVCISATVMVEGNDTEAMESLRKWVLKEVKADVESIRSGDHSVR